MKQSQRIILPKVNDTKVTHRLKAWKDFVHALENLGFIFEVNELLAQVNKITDEVFYRIPHGSKTSSRN